MFATLTVEENLRALVPPVEGSGRGAGRRSTEAFELFPALASRRRQLAGTLSGGEQRMLSMARVLVEAPRLLIADELSLGLAPIIVDEIYARLGRLREQGTALLIVEQHVAHALDLCDRVVLLDHGTVRWQGPAADAGQHVVAEMFEHG